MAKSRKIEPAEALSPSRTFRDALMDHTAESPLIVCGTVLSRTKKTGKNDRGDWEMFFVEVRGSEGRVITVLINSPETIPAKGEFVIIPVFVTKTGDLRECKKFGDEF